VFERLKFFGEFVDDFVRTFGFSAKFLGFFKVFVCVLFKCFAQVERDLHTGLQKLRV